MREEIHFDESFFIKVYCQDQCDKFYSESQDDNFHTSSTDDEIIADE